MPLFRTKKEAFEWLTSNKKTIDVRKGSPHQGDTAVYLSGRKVLKMKILKKETGRLEKILSPDNYRMVIPSAGVFNDAVVYIRNLYGGYDGVFTAYYVAPLNE